MTSSAPGERSRGPVVVWQAPTGFNGEDIHRIGHRRLRALLARRLGAAPRFTYATGGPEETLALLDGADPAAALVIATWSLEPALALLAVAAERAPETPVILSGWAADPDFIDALRAARPVHHPRLVVARGEPEPGTTDALAQILTADGAFPAEALVRDGLAVSLDGSSWLSRGRYREVADLATLPSAYLEGEASVAEWDRFAFVEVARGCLNRCQFCVSCNFQQRGLRLFPPDQVCAEIELASREGARYAGLMCTALNYHRPILERVVATYERLPESARPLVESTIHTAHLDAEALRLVSRLPWNVMIVGLQSTNPAALRRMGRTVDLADFRRKIEALSQFHHPVVELILGLPDDSLEGFRATLAYVLDLPAKIEIYPLRFSPGSAFMGQRDGLGLVSDFAHSDRVVGTPTFPADDLRRAVDLLRETAARPWPHRARYLGFDFRPLFDGTRAD